MKCLGVGSYTATVTSAFSVGQGMIMSSNLSRYTHSHTDRSVPHGGYIATCLLEAAGQYMKLRNQSDVICAHFEFLDRAEPGSATVLIEDVKIGKQLSTIHLTLYQRNLLSESPWVTPKFSRKKVVAYMTCTDLRNQRGLSLPTSFTLQPSPPPIDFDKLSKHGADDNWGLYTSRSLEHPGFPIRFWDNLIFYVPLRGQPSRSIVDVWLRLACGEPFTNSSLAFVADAWPHLVEGYRAFPGQKPDSQSFPATEIHWYPTVVFNFELKKGISPQGTDWLRMRVTAKDIRNGKLDMETLIYDKDGDLIALSNHVNLILSANRNLAKRETKSNI